MPRGRRLGANAAGASGSVRMAPTICSPEAGEVAGLDGGVLGQRAVAGPVSQSEHPLADGQASRRAIARMAISFVVRVSGFFFCGEDVRIRAHRSSGLAGRQGLSPHGGRGCLSSCPRYHRQFQQDRRARPASGWGTRVLADPARGQRPGRVGARRGTGAGACVPEPVVSSFRYIATVRVNDGRSAYGNQIYERCHIRRYKWNID